MTEGRTNFAWPQWTSLLSQREVTGEDQLGIEGAAQSYQQYLMPGIISTTEHARYYSFYSWVLLRFIRDPGSTRLLKDFRGSYFKRHELVFILAAYSHHEEEGGLQALVGSSKGRTYWESEDDPVSLDQAYFQNTLGGFGQYYRTAMQAMGILAEKERPTWVYRLTERGERLAQAYGESISETNYADQLEKHGELTQLSREDAQELGRYACLCHEALSKSVDLELLREAFFRFDSVGWERSPHARRRAALGLVLDLVEKGGGALVEGDIRPTLYLMEFEAGRSYRPALGLERTALHWRLVTARHMYTFGLQCLWGAFLLRLREARGGLTFESFMSWVESFYSAEVMRTALLDFVSQVGLDAGVEWASIDDFDDICNHGSDQNEYALYQEARTNRKDPANLLRVGTLILMQVFLRFRPIHAKSDLAWNRMATQERLPIKSYFDTMENSLKDGSKSLADWFDWIYRDLILGQHEHIALEKLRTQGYDTFKFYYQDGRFHWPFSNQASYDEPIRFAGLRLDNALSILVDLGLVSRQETGAVEITPAGHEHLHRALTVAGDDN